MHIRYINSYPRRWHHIFPEIRENIPLLFRGVGNAHVEKSAGMDQFLVVIDLHTPIQVRYGCLFDGTSEIAINRATGACIRWRADISKMPENGERQIRVWLDYFIPIFEQSFPDNRVVDIEELCQHYRNFAYAMVKVWEIT